MTEDLLAGLRAQGVAVGDPRQGIVLVSGWINLAELADYLDRRMTARLQDRFLELNGEG